MTANRFAAIKARLDAQQKHLKELQDHVYVFYISYGVTMQLIFCSDEMAKEQGGGEKN